VVHDEPKDVLSLSWVSCPACGSRGTVVVEFSEDARPEITCLSCGHDSREAPAAG
jgi:Zn ribbon nucleic-acid-binding protein